MDRDEIIGNVTTIGKILLCTFGTPSMVAFVNSNDYILLVSAVFGLIWAFYDSKYFNTFFNRNKNVSPVAEYDEGLNQEYTAGDEDE